MTKLFVFAILALALRVTAQCNGACQNKSSDPCSSGYVANLCPGGADIECCKEVTDSCPGACQDKSLACHGTYKTGLCPGSANVVCCVGVQPFGDRNWDCANPDCTSVVADGAGQPNYECAEFVARSLAAGGLIPNIGAFAAQSSYGNYHYNSVVYDLLWVSSKQGGPLGLGDCLLKMGWHSNGTTASAIKIGSYVAVDGSAGAYSHVALGVGSELLDAHNNARYHVGASYYTINAIYNAPAFLPDCTPEECGPLPPEKYVNHKYDHRYEPSN